METVVFKKSIGCPWDSPVVWPAAGLMNVDVYKCSWGIWCVGVQQVVDWAEDPRCTAPACGDEVHGLCLV